MIKSEQPVQFEESWVLSFCDIHRADTNFPRLVFLFGEQTMPTQVVTANRAPSQSMSLLLAKVLGAAGCLLPTRLPCWSSVALLLFEANGR